MESFGDIELQGRKSDTLGELEPAVEGGGSPLTRTYPPLELRPYLVVDPNRRILSANQLAFRMLSAPLPVVIEGGALVTKNASRGINAIEELLAAAGAKATKLLIKSEVGPHWALLSAWAEDRVRNRIWLMCTLSIPPQSVEASGMADDFKLTPAECVVLDYFAKLYPPKQIAEMLDVSLNTVRSHFKQLHAKIGLSSGPQLMRLTRAYCDR